MIINLCYVTPRPAQYGVAVPDEPDSPTSPMDEPSNYPNTDCRMWSRYLVAYPNRKSTTAIFIATDNLANRKVLPILFYDYEKSHYISTSILIRYGIQ